MSEVKLDSLYKRKSAEEYICLGTGNKCEIASTYFHDFHEYVQALSKSESNVTFFTKEVNLCVEKKCPIYNYIEQKILENLSQNKIR